jgi:hypothetical protein
VAAKDSNGTYSSAVEDGGASGIYSRVIEDNAEAPERAIEAIVLDSEVYDALSARLASGAEEDPQKLLAFFAKSETVYR